MSRIREEARFGEDQKKQDQISNIINQTGLNPNTSKDFNSLNKNPNNNTYINNEAANTIEIQNKLLEEINKLKNSRPYSTSKDLEKLRKENESLIRENKQLKSLINDQAVDLSGNPNENPKALRNKINYLEKYINDLERERTSLSVKATQFEEQLKSVESLSEANLQKYQRKILELTKRVNLVIKILV